MAAEMNLTRRALIVGTPSGMHHISSAVIVVLPQRRESISSQLAAMRGIEIHAQNSSRIVITIEGSSTGELGGTLTRISQMDGVISANMVFEHVEQQEGGRS